MEALFIGQSYIDVTFLADEIPTGDEKSVARDYSISFGGNAVTAAFACAKLGVVPDLLTSMADDWLGRMFVDMAAKYGISVHHRKVAESSLSFIMPRGGKRAIVRCRDDNYLHPVPPLNIAGCRGLHLDGHQPDAAIQYAKTFREAGILTSLDGGGQRANTHELLEFIDVAIVAERLCEQMDLSPAGMLGYLKSRGCRIGGVTLGHRGMVWYDEEGREQVLPALDVPSHLVIDTNGAGDIFHGAYMYSAMARPEARWLDHFVFARGASAHSIQRLGNENSIPSLDDVRRAQERFSEKNPQAELMAG
jgi:sugar/nucleoside kinase (ribokinase family)